MGGKEGECSFIGGRENAVIDYVIGNEDTRNKVERIKMGGRIDSDHHPVAVWLSGGGGAV